MDSIPTAQEFFEERWQVDTCPDEGDDVIQYPFVLEAMREFAKIHVEQALKIVNEDKLKIAKLFFYEGLQRNTEDILVNIPESDMLYFEQLLKERPEMEYISFLNS